MIAMLGVITIVIALSQYTPEENSSRPRYGSGVKESLKEELCSSQEETASQREEVLEFNELSATAEITSQTDQIQEHLALPESPQQEEAYSPSCSGT